MKKFAAIALTALMGLCTASHLQALDSNEVRANIPFDFIVGGKTLPAGSYQFFTDRDHILVVRNLKESTGALSQINGLSSNQSSDNNVVFHKYGNRYFLSEIHSTSVGVNGELSRSRLESKVQKQEASLREETVLRALGN